MRQQIEEIESSLENPHSVEKGDTHWSVCYEYLTEQKGLSNEKASNLLSRTSLVEQIVPGFYIFNLYYNSVFLTTITQGEASISP
ncbi:MAG: hypothetical protein ACE5IR_21490, partial [bacterium]